MTDHNLGSAILNASDVAGRRCVVGMGAWGACFSVLVFWEQGERKRAKNLV